MSTDEKTASTVDAMSGVASSNAAADSSPVADSVSAVNADAERRGRLLRVLGVVFGMAVTVGITIGMGILRTPGEVAASLPNVWAFLGVWLLGGLYALLGTVQVAELGTMIPRSGGFYVFARHALGEYPGFIVGWSDWLSTCGTVAAVALVIGQYAETLVPALAGRGITVASSVAVAFAVLQWRGVRWGSRSQELTSLLKTLAFAALIAACFAFGGGQASGLPAGTPDAQAATPAMPEGLALVGALVLALQGVIYTYDGWYSTVYFGEEVRDTARSLPRAMFGSVLLVIAIYLLFNLALVYVLPIGQLAGQKLAAGAAATKIFGARGGTIIGWVAVVSLLASVNGNTLTAPRIIYAMSRDRLFWTGAARVNRGGTPTVSLALSTAAAVAMIVFSGRFERVLAALAFFFVTNYTAAFVSVFVLRRREPDAVRPYRAWGYPLTTALALLGSIAFLVGAVFGDTENSVMALKLLAASLPVFLLLRLWRRVFAGGEG
jgi:APA family basic amino acid/polyamine antiporter